MNQLFVLLLVLSIISCSNDVSKENKVDSEKQVITKRPTQTIQINKSIVLARLISKKVKNETDFTIRVKILNVEENSNYESIAVAGEEYTLKPNFYYDEKNKISDNERNSGLKEIVKLNVGDEFNAEISLDQHLGWTINKVLK